jgi:ubiquinone/menaquinone biosynthesis C-methylase UbiE
MQNEIASPAIQGKTLGSYRLGYSEAESQRLMLQAEVLAPITRRLMLSAGLREGMRVLDIGCGVGDVSMLAADIVGPTGMVVGIDLNADSVALARARADERGYRTIAFEAVSLYAFEEPRSFDFAIGRYVLIHQADSVAALEQIKKSVKPGGAFAFHEIGSYVGVRSYPAVPLWDQVGAWQTQHTLGGANPYAATRLPQSLERAGLTNAGLFCEMPVAYGKDPQIYAWMAETQRTFLPAYVSKGIVSAEELDIETLQTRLEDAVTASGSLVIAWPQICAWATA